MNALIRKEARLLLPSTVVVLLLTTLTWYATENGVRSILLPMSFLAGTAMFVMLTLDSFGRELSAGTFSQLLSQPIPRECIWRMKTLMLAAAVVVVTVAWCLSVAYVSPFAGKPDNRNETLKFAVAFAVAAYSGGLWTVLLLRQVAAAFWFTVLIPIALMVFTNMALPDQSDSFIEAATAVVLIAYSIAGFFFARRLFLRAQDAAWTGGDVEVPGLAKFLPNPVLVASAPRGWRPRAALLKKEFQLHQPLLFMAALLAAFHLVVVLLRNFGGDLAKQPVMAVIFGGFWALWLVMPLLIGCSAVAEERKLGTLESQLCLPVKRGRQFRFKLGVALLLCVLVGAVMPVLFEHSLLYRPWTGHKSDQPDMVWAALGLRNLIIFVQTFPIILLAIASAAIGALSFYISTMTRTTLQSLAPAIGTCIAVFVLLIASPMIGQLQGYHPWRGALIHLIAVPIMVVVLLCLMRWNFKHVLVGRRVVGANILVLLIGLASSATLTAALYHRVWELLPSSEPVHGPARLAQRDIVKMRFYGQGIVHLRDGRVWQGQQEYSRAGLLRRAMLGDSFQLSHGGFLPGTNWTDLANSYFAYAGVQTDGSLWISEGSKRSYETRTWPPAVRFGTDNDWAQAAYGHPACFLLKTNGTLWRLAPDDSKRANRNQRLLTMTPRRLGTDSDWAEISDANGLLFQKRDGRVWDWNQNDKAEVISFGDDAKPMYRNEILEGIKQGAGKWWNTGFGGSHLGICDDGTLRIISSWQMQTNFTKSEKGRREYVQAKRRTQIGDETNWVEVVSTPVGLVTLKADGTLWRWDVEAMRNPNGLDPLEPHELTSTRLDSHTDWVGLCPIYDGVIALAADGSLWSWHFNSPHRSNNDTLLGAPRKPRLLGNIFANPGR